jgi:hypothetical protein
MDPTPRRDVGGRQKAEMLCNALGPRRAFEDSPRRTQYGRTTKNTTGLVAIVTPRFSSAFSPFSAPSATRQCGEQPYATRYHERTDK